MMRRVRTGALYLLSIMAVLIGTSDRSSAASVSTSMSEKEILEVISESIAGKAVVRAKINQEKRLQVLTRPLVSNGRMIYAADEGAYWEVIEPYAIAFVLKSDHVLERTEGQTRRLSMQDNPVVAGFSRVLLAVLGGDISSLKTLFNLETDVVDDRWVLNLKPRKSDLKDFIKGVSVLGDESVERVTIQESSGDETILSFSEISYEPNYLSSDERSLFAQ